MGLDSKIFQSNPQCRAVTTFNGKFNPFGHYLPLSNTKSAGHPTIFFLDNFVHEVVVGHFLEKSVAMPVVVDLQIACLSNDLCRDGLDRPVSELDFVFSGIQEEIRMCPSNRDAILILFATNDGCRFRWSTSF
jgi:hypothetical protein